jgi:preprotein translocase subunit SecY
MTKRRSLSWKTRSNWLIDAAVFVGGLLAALSGIYFLFLPSGGYQGGRNPLYGVTILFGRHAWEDVHTWGGVLMIAAIVVHFAIHWQWVVRMSRRVANGLLGRGSKLPSGAKRNLAINALVGASFLICAVSGIYFLFAPSGGFQGGSNPGWDPMFLFTRTTWDLIHTWSGVVVSVAAVVHFAIHWRWVQNVTLQVVRSLLPQREPEAEQARVTA